MYVCSQFIRSDVLPTEKEKKYVSNSKIITCERLTSLLRCEMMAL